MSDQSALDTQESALLKGYVTESQMAAARGVSTRALRDERQRGKSPPFTKMGKTILYSIEGFRDWLKANERRPTRSGRAA
jgi:hypothetical protein